MGQDWLNQIPFEPGSSQRMPVIFIGHGSPMNAIEDNRFSRAWHGMRDPSCPARPRSCESRPLGDLGLQQLPP